MNFVKTAQNPAFILSGLLALTIFAYHPVWYADFVYDDLWFIVHNPALGSLSLKNLFLNAASVATPGAGMALDIYRPLATLSFAVGWRLWGLHAPAEHLVNLVLHLLNGVLFYQMTKSFLKSPVSRFLATGVFLLHPAQVETVAWASQRSTLLCASGFLLALQGFLRRPTGWGRGISGWFLSAFSKETGIMLAPVGLVIDRTRIRMLAAWALLTLSYWLLRHHVLGGWSSSAASGGFHLGRQLSLGVLAFPVYLAKALVPIGLRVSYDTPNWTVGGVLQGAAIMLSYVAVFAGALYRRRPWAVPLGWFLLLLSPVMHLVPIVPFVAERFLYLPLMGVALAAGMLTDRSRHAHTGVLLWLASLFLLCVQQTPVWKTENALWANAARHDPRNAFAHACYAQSLGSSPVAEEQYFKALTSEPSDSIRHAACQNLAAYHHERGNAWKAQYWKAKADMRRLRP